MGGRPQKREKASGRKGWELGPTWNVKGIHVGIGFSCYVWPVSRIYVGTLEWVYVGTGLRWASVTGLRWKRGTGLR